MTHDVGWLFSDRRYAGETCLPSVAAIARVTSQRDDDAAATRFYVSSAPMSAERFAAAIRGHWGIENRLHWVLDTAFDENRARNRKDNGPENLAILRKLTLNVMRRSRPELGITRKRSGWSDDSQEPSSVNRDSPCQGGLGGLRRLHSPAIVAPAFRACRVALPP